VVAELIYVHRQVDRLTCRSGIFATYANATKIQLMCACDRKISMSAHRLVQWPVSKCHLTQVIRRPCTRKHKTCMPKQHSTNHTKQGAKNFPKIYKPPSNSSCQNCWHAVRSLLMTQNSWITAKLIMIWSFLFSACDLSHISVSQEQKNCNKYAENSKCHQHKI